MFFSGYVLWFTSDNVHMMIMNVSSSVQDVKNSNETDMDGLIIDGKNFDKPDNSDRCNCL